MPSPSPTARCDAPRAGSAEAKNMDKAEFAGHRDAPRAGSAEAKFEQGLTKMTIGDAPRAGSAEAKKRAKAGIDVYLDAPRAGSAEAKVIHAPTSTIALRCTPCRQRRGKEGKCLLLLLCRTMHPVQAAPRQSTESINRYQSIADAPRAGSAEAKSISNVYTNMTTRCTPCRQRRGKGKTY